MNNTDLFPLQQEIVRLNKIISALLEQIDVLKQNNFNLQKQIEANNAVHSHVGKQVDTNELLHSHLLQQGGINHPLHSNTEKEVGTNSPLYPNTEKQGGMNKTIYPDSLSGLPSNSMLYPDLLQGLPSNESFRFDEAKGMPPKRDIYSQLPQQGTSNSPLYAGTGKGLPSGEAVWLLPPSIIPSGANVGLLSSRLRQSLLKRSQSSAQINAAKLLIHFYNKGTGSYSELQKLTGYSTGGLAKLMMLVRRKGLIKRSAYQQFAPTSAALQLIHEAMLK